MSETLTLRLTKDTVSQLQPGDLILDGGEFLGEVRHSRLTFDGYDNLKIYGTKDTDILGLPSTIRVQRG